MTRATQLQAGDRVALKGDRGQGKLHGTISKVFLQRSKWRLTIDWDYEVQTLPPRKLHYTAKEVIPIALADPIPFPDGTIVDLRSPRSLPIGERICQNCKGLVDPRKDDGERGAGDRDTRIVCSTCKEKSMRQLAEVWETDGCIVTIPRDVREDPVIAVRCGKKLKDEELKLCKRHNKERLALLAKYGPRREEQK